MLLSNSPSNAPPRSSSPAKSIFILIQFQILKFHQDELLHYKSIFENKLNIILIQFKDIDINPFHSRFQGAPWPPPFSIRPNSPTHFNYLLFIVYDILLGHVRVETTPSQKVAQPRSHTILYSTVILRKFRNIERLFDFNWLYNKAFFLICKRYLWKIQPPLKGVSLFKKKKKEILLYSSQYDTLAFACHSSVKIRYCPIIGTIF